MKVVALMSFWDEQPAMLTDSIRSLHGLADHLVAVDGAYATFPGAQARSPQGHAAIQRACREASIGLTMHVPDTAWQGGEIEKRDTMFRIAEDVTGPADWYFIQDADFVVTSHWGARQLLEETDLLAGEICLVDSDGSLRPHRLFFRALRNIRVAGTHYQWQVQPDGPIMWDFFRPSVPPLDLTQTVIVDHVDDHRLESRDVDRWRYYESRAKLGLERPQIDPDFDIGQDGPERTLFGRRAGRKRNETPAAAKARSDARIAELQYRPSAAAAQ